LELETIYNLLFGLTSPENPNDQHRSQYIDLPANDFALLAAIDGILRQFCMRSRPRFAALRLAAFPRFRPKSRVEHARLKQSLRSSFNST
jgi:hypothetical protein